MLNVSLHISAFVTSPSLYIPCTAFDWMYDWNLKQSCQSLFAAFDMIIFLPESFFSSFVSLSVTCNHEVDDSVCLKWLLELSVKLSLDHLPGIITYYGRCYPIQMKEVDNASLSLFFDFIENKDDQQKSVENICAHLLSLLDTLFESNVSL